MKVQYEKLHFYGQHPRERIILLVRRHWFIPFKFVSLFVFLIILPPIIYAFLPLAIKEFLSFGAPYIFLVLALSVYYLILWLYFFIIWINYYLDVWIVTNERIINIQQLALFKRIVSEQKITRVQDVTSEVVGIIPTFFNFGNIYVQTAGTKERFVFEQVPHPEEIKRVILSAHGEAVKEQGAEFTQKENFGKI